MSEEQINSQTKAKKAVSFDLVPKGNIISEKKFDNYLVIETEEIVVESYPTSLKRLLNSPFSADVIFLVQGQRINSHK